MRDVVITSGVRTAIGDFGGALSGIPPCDLAIAVAIEAYNRLLGPPVKPTSAAFDSPGPLT